MSRYTDITTDAFNVENVTERMTIKCHKCRNLPVGIRLRKTNISLNRFHDEIFCRRCGIEALLEGQDALRSKIDGISNIIKELDSTDKSGC